MLKLLLTLALILCAAPAEASIRMLVLKHSKESMADGDADLALAALQKAAGKGLAIKSIGNRYINKDGELKCSYVVWPHIYDLPKLQLFVSAQMKVDAEPGDTFIVFTIGHGFTSGDLHNLGPRTDVMKALASAAEENNQKTLWWQLSCHACASLPKIESLSKPQQDLFSMFASSSASETSAAGVQGKIMEKLFIAMAEKNKAVDPNQDGIITAGELKSFLNIDRVFAKSMNEPIFGDQYWPDVIRFQDGSIKKGYVPRPR